MAVLAAAWIGGALYLFVWRDDDPVPRRADAVVVLAGDADHRIPAGLRLVRRGVARTLVLSREPHDWPLGRRLCADGGAGVPRVVCVTAHPYSTQGEAVTVSRLARARGWRSLVVVTSGYHVTRARLLFERCFAGELAVAGAGYDRRWLPLDLAWESVKLARAETVDRGCSG